MVNHPSRIIDSGAMKSTISRTKIWKLPKEIENRLVQKPEYIKLQTKHAFLFIQALSVWQTVHKPTTKTKIPLQAEKSSPISEINQTEVMEQQKSSL